MEWKGLIRQWKIKRTSKEKKKKKPVKAVIKLFKILLLSNVDKKVK